MGDRPLASHTVLKAGFHLCPMSLLPVGGPQDGVPVLGLGGHQHRHVGHVLVLAGRVKTPLKWAVLAVSPKLGPCMAASAQNVMSSGACDRGKVTWGNLIGTDHDKSWAKCPPRSPQQTLPLLPGALVLYCLCKHQCQFASDSNAQDLKPMKAAFGSHSRDICLVP